MASKSNFTIDQGANCVFSFDMIDDNDNSIDLTGYTGVAVMRKHYTSSNGHSFTVTIDADDGEVTLSMNAATTNSISAGRYVYDCELTDSDGVVSRVVEGIVTVTPRVRKS